MTARLAALLGLWLAPAAAAETRPNIIFFLADDQRHDCLGCAGHPILQTPNIDALAADGVRFERAFVTTSICAASRATLLTGLVERTHRFTFRTPPLAQKFLAASYPALMKRAGYRTGFIGKFGVKVPAGTQAATFDYFRPLGRNPYFKKRPDGKRHITAIAGDLALEFLKAQPRGEPFCLSVSFNAPHAEDSDKKDHYPWPASSDGMYDDVFIPPPPLANPAVYATQPTFLKKSLNRERWFWRWDTSEKYQRNVRAYYRMLSGVDHTVGRVVEELGRLGLSKNTVIVYMADNGYYLGSRGFAGKWSHYEESLRVPLVVRDPRVSASARGTTSRRTVLNLDIAPTLLDMAGIPVPSGYQGRSLSPLVRGEAVNDWRKEFFCEHLMDFKKIPKWEGVHTGRYVYARYFEQEPVYEFLHDLRADPRQLKNFADDPKHAETLKAMRRRCDELRDGYGGPYTKRR